MRAVSKWLPLTFPATAQFMKAASEVVEDPRKLENWRHKPALYALLKKMVGQ